MIFNYEIFFEKWLINNKIINHDKIDATQNKKKLLKTWQPLDEKSNSFQKMNGDPHRSLSHTSQNVPNGK